VLGGVVAEISRGRIGTDFTQERSNRVPLVGLVRANLHSTVEFQHIEPAVLCNRAPTEQHARPKILRVNFVQSTPMNGNTPALEFRNVAYLLVAEPAVGIRQRIERALVEARHLHSSVCLQPLQAVDSPNFRTWMNRQKGENIVRIPSGNDNQSSAAVAHDLLQERHDSGVGICLVALDLEWRQSSVIVEHQDRFGRPRYSL
jgi:hypothetical protein